MGIDGLGDAIVDQLLTEQKIKTVADLYVLKKDDLIHLERFGEKSTENLLTAIENSKTKPFANVLFALGIPFIGEVSASIIADHFNGFSELFNASDDKLINIDQIGPKMVNAIQTAAASTDFRSLVNQLLNNGINPTNTQTKRQSDKLFGKSFLITGTLSQPRSVFETKIKNNGGKITKSVSKSLNYLLVGESAGSKLNKS